MQKLVSLVMDDMPVDMNSSGTAATREKSKNGEPIASYCWETQLSCAARLSATENVSWPRIQNVCFCMYGMLRSLLCNECTHIFILFV
jgi:hypothetical protein